MNEFTMDMYYYYQGVPNRFVTLRKEKNGQISVLNEFGRVMACYFNGYSVGRFLEELFDGVFADGGI